MPGLNGRGPQGEGSGTGRGLGRCETSKSVQGNEQENDSNGVGRLRMGRRAGRKGAWGVVNVMLTK